MRGVPGLCHLAHQVCVAALGRIRAGWEPLGESEVRVWWFTSCVVWLGCGAPAETEEIVACDACGGACDAVTRSFSERQHVTDPIDYEDPPPFGGDHNPCWAPWGVHTTPVADDNWVHNLEHGGVVFLYDCLDGCEADATALGELASSLGPYSLVTPYSGMSRRFAVVAWGHRLEMDCLDTSALRQFYIDHQDDAPESTIADPSESCM